MSGQNWGMTVGDDEIILYGDLVHFTLLVGA